MALNGRRTWKITFVVLLFLFVVNVPMVLASEAFKPLPQDLEIELALSALPPYLREEATVYSLNPDRGFEIVRKGNNGFHTFVARTSPDGYLGEWVPLDHYPDDLLIPIAFDSAGAKANMVPWFDVAKMQAEGVSPKEAKRILKKNYETGVYKAPERAGISYMLAPVLRSYCHPDEDNTQGTVNFPHYMFYAPNVSNQDIGGGPPLGTAIWIFRPGPHGYMNLKMGEKEIADINEEYKEMIARLGKLKKEWRLPKKTK